MVSHEADWLGQGADADATSAERDSRIRFDVSGAVATATLCRPDRGNAQTPHTWAALRSFAQTLPSDVRVVVVRGEGASFSTGLDRDLLRRDRGPGDQSMLDLTRTNASDALAAAREFQESFLWLGRPDIVSVAAVQGHAIGAGCQLALACDLRIAARDAVFRVAEPSLGLVPDLGGTYHLAHMLGFSRSLQVCLTGAPVSADEALGWGLVNYVVGADDLDDAVSALVERILAVPQQATGATKALLQSAAWMSLDEQLLAERTTQLRLLHDLATAEEPRGQP